MSRVVFVDTETTGLTRGVHDLWEIAVIIRDRDIAEEDVEMVWHIKPDLSMAEPTALRLTHFYTRFADEQWQWDDPQVVAAQIAIATAGAHFVGAVPNFDDARIEDLLRANDFAPAWHYHLVDIEALMAGYLAGHSNEKKRKLATPPWGSRELSAAIGVTQPKETVHTALGDARWARDVYDAVLVRSE
jgi:hypothetical protein